jgi:hypothetical protein
MVLSWCRDATCYGECSSKVENGSLEHLLRYVNFGASTMLGASLLLLGLCVSVSCRLFLALLPPETCDLTYHESHCSDIISVIDSNRQLYMI